MRKRFVPKGWPTVIPRIFADDAEGLVAFVTRVFDAAGEYRDDRPSEITIGDSRILITDATVRQPMGAFLYVYVKDADDTYRRGIEAGAQSIEEPAAMPYGDRRAMFEDTWGNTWQVATHMGPPAPTRTTSRKRQRAG